jgi:putative effector of murein hydrolase LrgA (UPF0299 family)
MYGWVKTGLKEMAFMFIPAGIGPNLRVKVIIITRGTGITTGVVIRGMKVDGMKAVSAEKVSTIINQKNRG